MFARPTISIPRFMVQSKRYLKVGDKVPISYIKDAPPVTIKDDKEYPEWVFKLGEKVLHLNIVIICKLIIGSSF